MDHFCEIKNADDGDYTDGLIVCPQCARKSLHEGFCVTAKVAGEAVCASCGVTNAVPPYAKRQALRDATLAIGRRAS